MSTWITQHIWFLIPMHAVITTRKQEPWFPFRLQFHLQCLQNIKASRAYHLWEIRNSLKIWQAQYQYAMESVCINIRISDRQYSHFAIFNSNNYIYHCVHQVVLRSNGIWIWEYKTENKIYYLYTTVPKYNTEIAEIKTKSIYLPLTHTA